MIDTMMKKNILFLFIGLFVLVSCEKDIYENENASISIEQHTPMLENGEMKLSASVGLPKSFNNSTTKYGFVVTEFTSDMNNGGGYITYDSWVDDLVVTEYMSLISNDEETHYFSGYNVIWVDDIASDGSFHASFFSHKKQYMCLAFALNALDIKDYWDGKFQLLKSKWSFFTGEASAKLEMKNPFGHQFELTYSDEENIEVGICWSATNAMPNIEDECVTGDYRPNDYTNNTSSLATATFLDSRFNFGNNEVVYLRGYVKMPVGGSWNSSSESAQVVYSNVIELRPKNLVVEINSKEDMQAFINSMYICRDSINGLYEYRGYEMWDSYHGKINFNYEVQKSDWIDPQEMSGNSDTTYIRIPIINGSIIGKGVIPTVERISETGFIQGMTLSECWDNYGLLENVHNSYINHNYGSISGSNQSEIGENKGTITNATYVNVNSNYGKLTNSQNVYVDSNYGLVQNCKDVYGTKVYDEWYTHEWNKIVNTNKPEGSIINCTIENNNTGNTYLICGTNYGYMENCLPNRYCCENNHGVIKNPYNESEYEDPEVLISNLLVGTWECDTVYHKDINNHTGTTEESQTVGDYYLTVVEDGH